MIVPKYWAEAKANERKNRKPITVHRFGWSDVSLEDAQRNADERAAQALARIIAGEKLKRRDLKIAYNGADGTPIREEIVATHGETIITRNSYGARCLNSPNVLFADIDFDQPTNRSLTQTLRFMFIGAAIAIGAAQRHLGILIVGMIVALIISHLLGKLVQNICIKVNGGSSRVSLQKIQQFVAKRPKWRVRIYETPAGLRVLALHRTFDPREAEVHEFFTVLATDLRYARMCVNQNCFRARLTAKPWRIGMSGHMKPRPGVWPIKAERMADRQQWIDKYDSAAGNHAACRFLEELGSTSVDPTADEVRKLHDELSGALGTLPIA